MSTAKPMDINKRIRGYLAQTGRPTLTRRQVKRVQMKARRLAARDIARSKA